MASSTQRGYARSWNLYKSFSRDILKIDPQLPCPVANLALFIAYLFAKGYSPTSLPRILSAISYVHKMLALQDPTKNYFLSKLLGGAKLLNPRLDNRLPITRPILERLLIASEGCISSGFDRAAFKAASTLGFAAFLRIGEMFFSCNQDNCLRLADVSLGDKHLLISMSRFKSVQGQGAQTIRFDQVPGSVSCPLRFLSLFLSYRGPTPGNLFASPSGKPIPRRLFDGWLKKTLEFSGLDASKFKGHSLRIGAASQAAADGKSDAFIRLAGRWSSDAFRKYIRAL